MRSLRGGGGIRAGFRFDLSLVRGTLAPILEQYKNKKVGKGEVKNALFELVKKGFRIREEMIVEILSKLG